MYDSALITFGERKKLFMESLLLVLQFIHGNYRRQLQFGAAIMGLGSGNGTLTGPLKAIMTALSQALRTRLGLARSLLYSICFIQSCRLQWWWKPRLKVKYTGTSDWMKWNRPLDDLQIHQTLMRSSPVASVMCWYSSAV